MEKTPKSAPSLSGAAPKGEKLPLWSFLIPAAVTHTELFLCMSHMTMGMTSGGGAEVGRNFRNRKEM